MRILRAVVRECRVERITFMAGSIAYNAFVSLLPLLFLLLAVVTAVGDSQFEAALIGLVQSVVTPGAGSVLVTELQQASTGASILGFAVLAWGMLRIFRTLDTAFSDIYETEADNTFLNQLVDGITVFVSIAAVIVAVVALESSVSLSAGSALGWLLQRLLLICLVAAALVPMYYLFPDESDMRVLETLPGVFVTASALVAFQSGFSIYVQYSSQTAENGILASILIFMTWLYFSGLVVLVGAVVNAVLTNRSDDVNIAPVLGGNPKHELADGDDQQPVSERTLKQLTHNLEATTGVTITVDNGEQITVPAPEVVTVEVDAPAIREMTDTAALELRWAQDRDRHHTDESA